MLIPFESLYTLPFLDGERESISIRWIPDPKLRHHIRLIQVQTPELIEADLVRVFLTNLKQNPQEPTTKGHLVAFLSRFSHHSAHKVMFELEQLKRIPSDAQGFRQDLFQITLEAALDPGLFFKSFDTERSQDAFWYPSLRQYIRRRMEGILCDKIRGMEGMTTYKRSDLGLASRSSRRKVTDALEFIGITEPQLAQYILVWNCFQEVRTSHPDQTDTQAEAASPAADQFQGIADRYNRLRAKLPQAVEGHPIVDGPLVEKWLKQIGAAVRCYLDRGTKSLDAPINLNAGNPNAETSTSSLDQLFDPTTAPEWGTLAVSEMQAELQSIQKFLDDLLEKLQPEGERIPLLMHGLKLAQAQIGIELEKNQSTIGRNYQKLLAQLLKQLGAWVKAQQKIDLDSETLSAMKNHLEEQIEAYYAGLIDHFFADKFNALADQDPQLLRLNDACAANPEPISSQLKLPHDQGMELLVKTKQSLQESVAARIEDRLHQALKPQGPARQALIGLSEAWLKIVLYSTTA
ncbi:MAG: hypothetical protein KME35_00200 [Aphanocapsa sp. GSE-SYN-MK-11-07L]|jgi:RNA polymerase sigma factor (sigma-70 family)|nr:hypothetical protein [Aphanocapsa sp. GSE-SYN-MK-11-07L]